MGKLSNMDIFYSSLVMDKFGDAGKYFNVSEGGQIKDKTLGVMLLEAGHMSGEAKKSRLKDIADTSLLVCGFFSKSLNRKIIDLSYYQELGQSAYVQLNQVTPSFYDTPSFYRMFAGNFHKVTSIMNFVADKTLGNSDSPLLILESKISA